MNNLQQKIIETLEGLDVIKLSEVLDFIEFIHTRTKQNSPDKNKIDELCGKYKNRLSSSIDFAKNKTAEKSLNNKKWVKK